METHQTINCFLMPYCNNFNHQDKYDKHFYIKTNLPQSSWPFLKHSIPFTNLLIHRAQSTSWCCSWMPSWYLLEPARFPVCVSCTSPRPPGSSWWCPCRNRTISFLSATNRGGTCSSCVCVFSLLFLCCLSIL